MIFHRLFTSCLSVALCFSTASLAQGTTAKPSRLENSQSAISQFSAQNYAMAQAAAQHDTLARYYKARDYRTLWVGSENTARRAALFEALTQTSLHGLPQSRYRALALKTQLKAARTLQELGVLDVEISRSYLQYAQDLSSGLIAAKSVVPEIVRDIERLDPIHFLTGMETNHPAQYLKSLAPNSNEYTRLMRHKLTLENRLTQGGWGEKVPTGKYQSGDRGPHVVSLRNRLIRMGYLPRTASQVFDAPMKLALERFQRDHGLTADGTAGPATLAALNTSLQTRLHSIIVAMERERWLPQNLGQRHIWVNLTDFHARVVDDGDVTFETRSVIGAKKDDRESPEFSDTMEFMVINPTWYIPRSIVTKEYLPKMKNNPNALKHLQVTGRGGNVIARANIDFSAYTAKSFPFSMRQPPSKSNALGLVKFMFPNKYNIYLHDTPAKSLFGRSVRAFSHGCIRLNDPFDFAYHLLAKQTDNPKAFFQSRLKSGNETHVNLDQPIPVHIVYRTAFSNVFGQLQFRGDVYSRDQKIWAALERAGVTFSPSQS